MLWKFLLVRLVCIELCFLCLKLVRGIFLSWLKLNLRLFNMLKGLSFYCVGEWVLKVFIW